MATVQSFAVPPAMIRYGDIIMLGRPVHNGDLFSRRHPKMTPLHRAKIFAPFAALVGFDEYIRSKEVQYVDKHELDADEEWKLNRKLNMLHDLTANSRLARANKVTVTVEYFVLCTDPNHDAYGRKGLYETITGVMRKVDNVNQSMTLYNNDGEYNIAFEDIYDITDPTGALFVRRGA